MPTSRPADRAIVVAAVLVLLASMVLVWNVADVRADRATSAEQIDAQVPERLAPADYDGDGIPDDRDVCPTRPETTNGFQDGDGCPDVVATTGAS